MEPIEYLKVARFTIYGTVFLLSLVLVLGLGYLFRHKVHHWAYTHQQLRGYFPPYKMGLFFVWFVVIAMLAVLVGQGIGDSLVSHYLDKGTPYARSVKKHQEDIDDQVVQYTLSHKRTGSSDRSSKVSEDELGVITLRNFGTGTQRLTMLQEYPLSDLRTRVPYVKAGEHDIMHRYSVGGPLFYLTRLSNLPLEIGLYNVNQIQYTLTKDELKEYKVIRFKVYNQLDKKTYEYVLPLKVKGNPANKLKTITLVKVRGTLLRGELRYSK